jgi:RHS repeat-associated protein
VRTYSFGGGTVATRTPDGVSYLSGDQAGSAEMQIDSEDDVSATRAYTPYGNVRSETGDLATDRGFLGQVEDSTGLNYLNARYYDTTNGIFISPDPLYDTGRPRSQNPYAYAHGNPTTLSDPSGLWIPISNSNSPAIGYDHRVNGGRGGFIGQAGADTGISRSLANSITNIQRQQRKAYKQSVQNNAQRRKNEMRRQHEIATMNAMCKANCDPGFWHALAADVGAAESHASAVATAGCTIIAPGPGWQLWRSFTGSDACVKCREAGHYWANRLGRNFYCHGVGSRSNLYLRLP